MSNDSSDCSDTNFPPSGSRGRQQNRPDQKRKRRIVMRIEFDDSDESTSTSDRTSDDEDDVKNKNGGKNIGGNDLGDDGPSCSGKLCNRQEKKSMNNDAGNDYDDDSDDFQRNAAARRLRRGGRRINVLDVGFSDGSSSGSEITRQKNSRGKKYIFSEDERETKSPSKNFKTNDSHEGESQKQKDMDEQGFTSDSSSNDLLEKCPICLLTFRQQEIGSPSTCEHIFCANCIEAWSRNVQTCPIDRIEFKRIIVRESFHRRNIVREINVDPNTKKDLAFEDELVEEEDVTNCEICNRPDREDVMLLCDHCNQGYHMDCLSPPLSEVPEGSWYCDNCVDSQDEEDDEDLHMLYEDIRDMGIPENRLRVREVQQPRILRTRQNERIRAAIIRRTRTVIGRTETTTISATTNSISTPRGRHRTTKASTARSSAANKKRSASGAAVRKTYKRRSRRARQRTYVVEYDLNNFDEKFAIKTTKKVIKRCRRRRKAKSSKRGRKVSSGGLRMTASKRLAEQMGVKHDPKYSSHLSRAAGGLSLFGGANDLEYFSDSDDNDAGNIESEIHIETGHGTAVQTSVRISNYGSQRSRKSILLGRQPNRGIQDPVVDQNNYNPDILSSILNMQDRWHSAARNLENVHINSDGTLNLPTTNTPSSDNIPSTPKSIAKDGKSEPKQSANGPSSNDINQAPMYSRGGGTPNFNRGGGGYNNRANNNNQTNYRGGGGGNQYRHSTSGAGNSVGFGGSNASSGAGMNYNMVGRGNFNFSNNPNYVGLQGQQSNASPFQQRNFNQRNQQNQQQTQNNQRNNITISQQRHSLPFASNRNDNIQQQHQQQNLINSYGGGMPQTCLPPPHLILNQQTQQSLQTSLNENSLFGGLPPPMSVPPLHMNLTPVRMSVPPPPTPPAVVIPPTVNSSLFQLNSDYGNNDDDSNCPNFAIYSQESLQVAKSSETYTDNTAEGASNIVTVAKEDDENEDLVQLDDDDEIPMPPEPKSTENAGSSELYEPENPTEENDYDEEDGEKNNENQLKENVVKATTKDDGDDYDDDNSSDDEDQDKRKKDKGEEQPKHINSEKYDPEEDAFSDCSNNNGNEEIKQKESGKLSSHNDIDKELETVRSPSPAVSDIRLPESETAAANRKGVLELYDDSDWEELDIDRPKEIDNKSLGKNFEKETAADDENGIEQDRSYTPCLDENIDPEEHENEGGSTTPLIGENAVAVEAAKKDEKSNSKVENMDTELISDEEDVLDRPNKDRKKNQKSGDKRGDRRDNQKIEKFKKIGNKQKGRNYRGDKQPLANNRRGDKKRRSRSRSMSRSRSVDSFNSRGGRSRSRSPRFRSRGDRSRSRSRSNNKENQGRWSGNFRDGGRFNKNNVNQNNRLKRRELPRYDVRNVVGHHTPPKTVVRDRYGRDTSRNRRSTRSLSRGRRGPPPRSPFSRSRSRNRRLSISLSPSPPYNRRRSLSHPRPARNFSPARRRSTSVGRRTPPYRQRSRSPLRVMRSRSLSRGSEYRFNGRKEQRHLRAISPVKNIGRGRIRSRSLSMSPRYTPRLSRSRSRSKTPRPKSRKKKGKDARKKKSKKRIATMSPSPNRRISRQADPFEIEKPPKKKKRRTPRAKSPIHDDHGWSPSPSPPPQPIVDNYEYQLDKNVSWTPPMQSPLVGGFRENDVRSVSRTSRKDKNKRNKKKKKNEKRRDGRKEKKRKRRTETPEPAPSKEVFASGNNILVSVSFNKETTTSQQQHTQQTIVTLPPNREDLLSNRRPSVDRVVSNCAPSKKRRERRKKIDIKPVAIIDLERSPFQVEQEPTDVIVLTDSEEALERDQREHRRDRCRSESCQRDVDTESHRNQRSGVSGGQRGEKTPEHLDTIHEESYDLPQSGGPKTPPEPPIVKFNLQAKKQSKVRNPLHDENDDIPSDTELNERQKQQQQENHRSDLDAMHAQSNQKIGPNTPPESGPCSPDAYDPFEPTKSPSISPRSPTPPPSQLDASQNAICSESTGELGSNQKHLTLVDNEQRREQIPGLGGNVAQSASINPVDLVMALINAKSTANSTQDLVNKSNESQHNNMGGINSHEDSFRDKGEEGNVITVLSNLLITSGNMQHIPSISSPTPPAMSKKILPGLPKIGGSVGGSSSSGVNMRNGGGTSNNADDSFNINDIESPYSPGSADYEDLFEPPPDTNKRRSKRSAAGGGKPEVFDNLFGSSSPVGNVRLPSYNPSKKYKGAPAAGGMRKSKIKVGKSSDDNVKIYDDLPSSAVELHVKDKFLRKLNRQERVVDEVKLVLKPRFNRKQITKEDYKEIMRRAVPKICHSRSGEIDPFKIKKLIEAYVKKFRAKHKKLNLVNTGQVSSAVKCAAYLKKLSTLRYFRK